MKKIIFAVVCIATLTGCSGLTVQENIDNYIEKRDKAVRAVKVVKCQKDCIIGCNDISNTIDRVDCKTSCIEYCHEI
jgi:hypothetical protein